MVCLGVRKDDERPEEAVWASVRGSWIYCPYFTVGIISEFIWAFVWDNFRRVCKRLCCSGHKRRCVICCDNGSNVPLRFFIFSVGIFFFFTISSIAV